MYYQALGRVLTNAVGPGGPVFASEILEPGHETRQGRPPCNADGTPPAGFVSCDQRPGASTGGGSTTGSSMLPLLLLAGAAVGVIWFIRRKKAQEKTP